MRCLVDSDVAIDALRGLPEAHGLIRGALADGAQLHGSAVTRAEVLAGARPRELAGTLSFLAAFDWLAVTESIADHAASLARDYRKSHSGIDLVDYLIAATAGEHDLPLWTRNVRHYPMLKGLKPAYGG